MVVMVTGALTQCQVLLQLVCHLLSPLFSLKHREMNGDLTTVVHTVITALHK